jgi:RHS repeat-associated protein
VRTSKTVSGDTTEYALDLLATLPVVISDTDAVYLYGLDIIAQQQTERQYYMHDGLGSVRQILDSTGQIETNYAYDPFGVPVVGGDVSNPYQYTGEAWDAEAGLLYLRARYYQPEVGRFITKDPWAGDVWRPSTLNRYSYARNSPVSRTDPEGLNGHGPDPLCPECQEALPGYSVFEATASASMLVAGWLFEDWRAPEYLSFGSDHPLTQAVMRSPALWQFRAEWARSGYQLPWEWWDQSYEPRSGGRIPEDPVSAAKAFASQNVRLVLLGDPVGAMLGAFDLIKVDESQLSTDMVDIVAYNTMGWESATRVPGTDYSLLQDKPRSALGPGGTITQWFYWEEPMPMGCWIKAYEHLFEQRFHPPDAL